MEETGLRINVPTVVHETIDGETIAIHLGTGTYYSLDGVGARVWTLLQGGLDRAQIVARTQRRYDGDPDVVGAAVGALLDELVAEELIAPAAPNGASGGRPEEVGVPADRAGASAQGAEELLAAERFEAPILHKYTDMQEFMLVDPIHDVDEASGWPHARAG